MEHEDLNIVIARKLNGISERWNDLEGRIKETEKAKLEVEVASINELRYAGRKVVDAFFYMQSKNKEDHGKGLECIIVAEQYCENADHDLTDSLCTYFDKKIRTMVEKYGLGNMTKYFSDTPHILKYIAEANRIIPSSRSERQNRKEEYKKLKSEIVPKLIEYHETVLFAQEMIEIEQKQKENKEKKLYIITGIGVLFGVIGAVATVISIF